MSALFLPCQQLFLESAENLSRYGSRRGFLMVGSIATSSLVQIAPGMAAGESCSICADVFRAALALDSSALVREFQDYFLKRSMSVRG